MYWQRLEEKTSPLESEFLLYLGVLDYLKSHSTTLFHALTFRERRGDLPQSPDQNDIYLQYRQKASELMIDLTQKFYQTCIGCPYTTSFNFKDIAVSVNDLTTYLSILFDIDKKHYSYHFTYPEANQPLPILLGSQEASLHNPTIETIVGIPSGGTEAAIAAQLAYQCIHKKSPQLIFLAQSIHGFHHKGGLDTEQINELINNLHPNSIKGRGVLLVDDSANTGATLQTVANALWKAGAKDIQVHLVNHDPERIVDKYNKGKGTHLFAVDHRNANTTMGVISLAPSLTPSQIKEEVSLVELARVIAQQRLEDYYRHH